MKYHIITYGCQMNKSDSERIAAFLDDKGWKESSEEEAEVVILNACSVRRSAVDRIKSKAERIKNRKHRPKLILTGCALPDEDLLDVFDCFLKAEDIPLFLEEENDLLHVTPKRKGPSAFIPITFGCNNFCSYCVVPYTRGREISRNAESIIREARDAIKEGYREIWLLGQNVNSYNGGMDFPQLLQDINKIEGEFWIRFISSHPKDFSDNLIDAVAKCEKMSRYLNLPLQSGDDEILQKMNRPYTAKDYRELLQKIKRKNPDMAISTDIIVGFPGETERQFRNTAKLFHEADIDMAYISRYSPRPRTAAARMKDSVSNDEKKRREKVLNEILKEKRMEKNQRYKGEEITVLITEKDKEGRWKGKDSRNETVITEEGEATIGEFVKIKITEVSPWFLRGAIK